MAPPPGLDSVSMNPRTPILGVAAAVLLIAPAGLAGQAAPLVVEIRGGAAIPMRPFSDGARIGEGTAPGAAFSVALAFSGAGRTTLYGGFSQNRFACQDAGCGPGGRFVATGFDAGIRLNLLTRSTVVPWMKVGALTTRVESGGLPSSPAGVSKLAYGGEVGFGLYVGATRVVALNPAVRYSAVNTELPGGALLRLRYLVVDLGLALAF